MSTSPARYADPHQPNPARLTATATTKLPRWGLLGLCLIYILAGLITREPWKSEDVIGYAQMWSAVHGDWRQWLTPEVAGIAVTQEGPLPTWLGALSMMLLQPLALPFGGQPGARDYGRMLADASLLLLVGTLGVLWRSHETSAEPAALAFGAFAFYSLTRMLDHPRWGAVTLGIALGGAFLSRGFPALAPLVIGVLLAGWRCAALRPAVKWMALLSLPIALAISLAWWIPASELNPYWMRGWWSWNASVLGVLTGPGASAAFRNLLWFLWPTWPLVLLTIWRWRGFVGAPHIQIPLAMLIGAALMLLVTRTPLDAEFLAFVIPSAVLAALALPTLRRGLINALDWFAVMVFSFALAVIWLGWIAIMTGVPPKIARNIARQTPGYEAELSLLALAIAVVSTLAWIALVVWRLRERPTGLWRGTVLAAGGVVVNWLLLMTLWLPSINYSKSYREVSGSLAAALAEVPANKAGAGASRPAAARGTAVRGGECVRSAGLGLPQRASFAVFDGLVFERSADCPLVLLQGNASTLWHAVGQGDYAGAQVIWEGGRASDSRRSANEREYFMLLRTAPGTGGRK